MQTSCPWWGRRFRVPTALFLTFFSKRAFVSIESRGQRASVRGGAAPGRRGPKAGFRRRALFLRLFVFWDGDLSAWTEVNCLPYQDKRAVPAGQIESFYGWDRDRRGTAGWRGA